MTPFDTDNDTRPFSPKLKFFENSQTEPRADRFSVFSHAAFSFSIAIGELCNSCKVIDRRLTISNSNQDHTNFRFFQRESGFSVPVPSSNQPQPSVNRYVINSTARCLSQSEETTCNNARIISIRFIFMPEPLGNV